MLGGHVSSYDPGTQNLLEQLRGLFGSVPLISNLKSLALLQGLVQRQAALMSFVEVFRLLAMLFLVPLPLLLLMKRPAKGAEAGGMH